MKNIIIKLFILLILFNFPYKDAIAQEVEKDSVVVLPHEIAAWYLKRHKLAESLEVQLSIKDSIITVYQERVDLKDSVIVKEKANSAFYKQLSESHEETSNTYRKDAKKKDKKIKGLKWQRNGIGIIAIIVLILALVGS